MNQLSHARRCLTRPPPHPTGERPDRHEDHRHYRRHRHPRRPHSSRSPPRPGHLAATPLPPTPNPQPPRQARGPSCRPRSPVSPPARARPSPTRKQERRRHDQHTTQRPQASPAPGRRRGAHRRRARCLGTAAIPAFAARATYISPGNYLDFVIGRGWTEAAYQHWLTATAYRSASATPAVLSGPAWRKAGTAAAAQPRSGPDNRRSSRTRSEPDQSRRHKHTRHVGPRDLGRPAQSGRIGRPRATGGGG